MTIQEGRFVSQSATSDQPASGVSFERLRTLLAPRSIAVVGASDRSMFSYMAHLNVEGYGFEGRVEVVNPKGGTAHGNPLVTQLSEMSGPVDIAYVMVPAAAVAPTLKELSRLGTKNA